MKAISILTLFPSFFDSFLNNSIVKRAIAKGAVSFQTVDIRAHSTDRNHRVDDRPTGGGAGLVMRLEPLLSALRKNGLEDARKILLSPKGKPYRQKDAVRLAHAEEDIALICGHYEGIDARFEGYVDEQISLGDFVMTGGEIAAMAVADSITRLLPGAIAEASTREESFSDGLLEYPQYTFPRRFEGKDIPEVLFDGDHEKVRLWRLEQALRLTLERRPDLLERRKFTKEELLLLEKIEKS